MYIFWNFLLDNNNNKKKLKDKKKEKQIINSHLRGKVEKSEQEAE